MEVLKGLFRSDLKVHEKNFYFCMKKILFLVVIAIVVMMFFPQVFSSLPIKEIQGKIIGAATSLYENFLASPARAVMEKIKLRLDQIVTEKIHVLFGRNVPFSQ